MAPAAPLWPPLSPLPPEPTASDYAAYVDKAVQDALRKEHERRVKAHKQAVKDREVTLAERKKAEEKIRKAATKVAAKTAVREKEKADKGVPPVQRSEHDAAAADDGSLSAQRGRAELEHGPRTASPSPSPSGQPEEGEAVLHDPAQGRRGHAGSDVGAGLHGGHGRG